MTPAELKQKAARLEYKLDPGGVRQRKEDAARKHRRVEARREESGNAALSGRELDVDEALAAKNSVWAEAAALCDAGLGVPLREARTMVYLDRLRGLDPWERLTPPYDPPGSDPADADDSDGTGRFPDYGYDEDDSQDGDEGGSEDDGDNDDDGDGPGGSGPSVAPGQPGSPAGRAPLPALTNITVSAGTLLGWSDAPAEVAGFGLLDPSGARGLIAAASGHPRSRWCVTILGKDSEAIAHGCASGKHQWTPENLRDATTRAGPDGNQRAQLAQLLRQLKVTPAPIAKGECDHRHQENRYRPGRKLQHLVRARTMTCSAPGCGAQAIHNELDHTVPYPAGPSDECNLALLYSRHHHAKHAPGWKLTQPEPGVMRWMLPSGRVHTTRPTKYDEGSLSGSLWSVLASLRSALVASGAAEAAHVGVRQYEVAAGEGSDRPGQHDAHPGQRAERAAEPAIASRPRQVHDDRASLVGQVVDDLLQPRDVPEALRIEEKQRHHDAESDGRILQDRGDAHGEAADEREVQASAKGSRKGARSPRRGVVRAEAPLRREEGGDHRDQCGARRDQQSRRYLGGVEQAAARHRKQR
jgi:hypothetical protein